MLVLGIETSCDETSCAVVSDKKEILSNVVFSQIDLHKIYGGVVPELAARAHSEYIDKIIIDSLKTADVDFCDLDAVAAVSGPGLIGGVVVGMTAGKAIALANNKPFIAVNHLEGHALTARLTNDLEFPYLLLLTSGGHTQIILVKSVGNYEILGSTIDDAAGEAFDKTAKLLEVGYPGGPAIEKLIEEYAGDENKYNLSPPMFNKPNAMFSFSGLKTQVRNLIEKINPDDKDNKTKADIAASFQNAVVKSMINRIEFAFNRSDIIDLDIKNLVVAGGVAANKKLRGELNNLCSKHNKNFIAPPFKLCTDNGAMIAWAGIENLRKGKTSSLDFKPRPRWPIDEL